MGIKDIKWNNFVKPFEDFVKDYNEGLFGLVVALLTLALERILDTEVFRCPTINYEAYAISFFSCPIVILTLLNLLTIPAEGGVHIWTLCESCWIIPYRRRGDLFSGFLSAMCVGFVAPTAWIFLVLLDGQHLVCWELGYKFNDNVTESYVEKRGFNLTAEDYEDKVEEAKARSRIISVIYLSVAVVLLCCVIIIRRSCLKPYDRENRLPSLLHFERDEAFAARNELDRMLSGNDRYGRIPNTASRLQCHFIKRLINWLKDELQETQNDEEKANETAEIKKEIEEFEELLNVLQLWAKWQTAKEKRDDSTSAAKTEYESERDKLFEKRETRQEEANKILKECGESSSSDTSDTIIYQTWLLTRLELQQIYFDVDEVMKTWRESDDVIEDVTRDMQNEGEALDCPELRGIKVARYLVNLYLNRNPHCLQVEQVLVKFRSIYPRAATSDPKLRYVDVDNPMYLYIISGTSESESKEKPWTDVLECEWKQYLEDTHQHSCLWHVIGCRNTYYCPLKCKPASSEDVEDGRRSLLINSDYNNY